MSRKICNYCREMKDYSEFSPDGRHSTGRQSTCKPCAASKAAQFRKDRPHYLQAQKFGVTEKEIQELKEKAGGKCEICEQIGAKYIDHNHETGELRGLLCNGCNAGLGHLKDNPDILRNAVLYLERKGFYGG